MLVAFDNEFHKPRSDCQGQSLRLHMFPLGVSASFSLYADTVTFGLLNTSFGIASRSASGPVWRTKNSPIALGVSSSLAPFQMAASSLSPLKARSFASSAATGPGAKRTVVRKHVRIICGIDRTGQSLDVQGDSIFDSR